MGEQQVPYAGAAEARAAIDEVVRDAETRAERTRRYAASLEEVRVVGRHAAGATVTLDHLGAVVALEVDDRLAAGGGDRVGRAVLAAVGAARSRLSGVLDGIASDAFGPGSATAQHLREQAALVFGVPTPSARTAPAGALPDGVLR